MSVRPLVLLSLAGLLLACSSAPKPVPTPPPQQQVKKPLSEYEELGPLPAYQRELSGTLLGAPTNAEVELALLVIDNCSPAARSTVPASRWHSACVSIRTCSRLADVSSCAGGPPSPGN